METSLYRPIAIGIAAENKALRGHKLKITPTEMLPFLDGEIKEDPTPLNYKGTDADGQAYEGQVFTDNIIEATWLPEGSNRVTSPNVRRNERVIVYQFANAPTYYWRVQGLDDHLRRLETVVFGISATIDEGTTALTPENSYYFEMSSHTKKVTLSTCIANGELFAYLVQLDPGIGLIKIEDNVGNLLHFNSTDTLIHIKNKDGTEIYLDKLTLKVVAPDSIDIKAGNRFTVTVGGNVFEMTPAGTKNTTPAFDII